MKRLIFYVCTALIIFASFQYFRNHSSKKDITNQITKNIVKEMNIILSDSKLFERSNLSLIEFSKPIVIYIYLNEKSLRNPNDTRKFIDSVAKKYKSLVDTLEHDYLSEIKKAKLQFFIIPYRKFGTAFIFEQGKITDNYNLISEKINEEKLSIKKEEEKNKIVKAKRLELAKSAYGELKFGDSEATVRYKLKHLKFDQLQYRDGGFYYVYNVEIGQFNYELRCDFYENKLYRVRITSHEFTANYYDTKLKNLWQNLVDVITVKYGIEYGEYSKFYQLNSGYVSFTHTWHYETKKIQIGVGEEESTYYTTLWITDKPTEENIDKAEQLKTEEAKKSSSKKF